MSIKYLDFDLLIEHSGTGYIARVLESPAGEASTEFKVPFSHSDVEDFFVQIGHTRSFETPQIKKMHEFGQALFEAAFHGEVRDRLRASLSEVNRQGAGLRIRLRLADTPELGNLPWEFIYDPSLNRFLALSVETPLVRYLETSQVIQPLTIKPPLRILAMICGPIDFPKLDVEREWENLQESLSSLQSRGLVHLQRLTPPTLSSLQQQLRREQYHIFHFIGHGVFSKHDQDGFLMLENDQRNGHRLSGRDLGTLLHDHRPLRLAVLNACEGARVAMDDQFAGTAQSLIQQGIPAVIAMQFRITDQASITLAHEFYGSLADGYPVDAALTEARKAIKTQGNELEWGTPVLYMRSPDGHIFDVAPLSAEVTPVRSTPATDPQEAARLERLYTEALETFYLGKWDAAHQKFQAIVDAQPNNKDAANKLEISRQKMRLQMFNEQALAAEKAGDWDKAIQSLEELIAEDATFPEASARLAKARRQKQLADLYAEAQRLAQAEKWQAVLGIFQAIEKVDPRYPDPQGLRARAQNNLTKAKRESELEKAYTDGLRALDSSHWQEATRHLRRVRGLQAGYRETDQLLRRAESEIERAKKEKSRPKAVTAVSSPNYEWLTLTAFGLFFLSRFVVELFNPFFDRIKLTQSIYLSQGIYMPIVGSFIGISLVWILRMVDIKLTRKQMWVMILASATTLTISRLIGVYWSNQAQSLTAHQVMSFVFGLFVGALLTADLRQQGIIFKRKQSIVMILGWGFAFFIGYLFQLNLNLGILNTIHSAWIATVIANSMETGIAGLVGSIFTFHALKLDEHRHISWITAIASLLGFGLGYACVFTKNYADVYIGKILIWGFLGGTALLIPSRDIKKYILHGILGGISFYLGYIILNFSMGGNGFDLSTNSPAYLSNSFFPILVGGSFGLFFAVPLRRASQIAIFVIFAICSFTIFSTLSAFTSNLAMKFIYTPSLIAIVRIFNSGVLGLLLGAVWSYLNSPADTSSQSPENN
jgi:tetratricopeptide (TPR) repeat protein